MRKVAIEKVYNLHGRLIYQDSAVATSRFLINNYVHSPTTTHFV